MKLTPEQRRIARTICSDLALDTAVRRMLPDLDLPDRYMPAALCPVCGEELVRQDAAPDREPGDGCMCCEYFKADERGVGADRSDGQ